MYGYPGQNPLSDLPNQVGTVLYGNGYPPDYTRSFVEGAAKGAAFMVAAQIVARRMKARRRRVGQYTTPLFRATVLWWALFVPVALAQGEWKSWAVLIGGCVLDSMLAVAYLICSARRARAGQPRRVRGAHRAF